MAAEAYKDALHSIQGIGYANL